MKKRIFKVAKEFKIESENPLANLLIFLRAGAHIHQMNHWQTHGVQYYADHQLFERLYNESQTFIDEVAERSIGQFTIDVLDGLDQIKKTAEVVDQIYYETPGINPDDMVTRSLAIEEMIIDAIKITISRLEDSGDNTHGNYNLLEGGSDLHEQFVYLLKQRMR